MKLQDIKTEGMATAFDRHEIPAAVLEHIPACYRKYITGAVYELVNGNVGDVWLTESPMPASLAARYYAPDYWCLDTGVAC